jgi:hypothetical protein
MERARQAYFLLLGLACAVGWSTGLWAAPLVGFVLLELAWTIGERAAVYVR